MGAQAAWADNVVSVNPTSGSSSTQFDLTLPGTAKCSGDTASGGYHVYSYAVPASVNPQTLNFSSGAPNTGAVLIGADGTPYVNNATGVQTGTVQALPHFNWSPYVGDFGTGDDLFPGTWNVGIACASPSGPIDIPGDGDANQNGGFNYWNYQITFTAVGTAGDFSWQVVPTQQTPEAPLAIGLPLSALALGGAAFFVLRRRRRSASPVAG